MLKLPDKANVLLIAPGDDKGYWDIAPRLEELCPVEMRVESYGDETLLTRIKEATPAVAVFALNEEVDRLVALIRETRERTDAFAIVAASSTDRNREVKVRTAGLFCYLILPDEIEVVRVVVEAALQRYTSQRSLGME